MAFNTFNSFVKVSLLSILLPFKDALAKLTDVPYFYRDDRPMIVAHRGTYGYYPEHALGGYVEAYYNGCDFIEFDVQISKDGELVILHDPHLDSMTNVKDH